MVKESEINWNHDSDKVTEALNLSDEGVGKVKEFLERKGAELGALSKVVEEVLVTSELTEAQKVWGILSMKEMVKKPPEKMAENGAVEIARAIENADAESSKMFAGASILTLLHPLGKAEKLSVLDKAKYEIVSGESEKVEQLTEQVAKSIRDGKYETFEEALKDALGEL